MAVADTVIVELEARTGQYERNIRNAESTTTRAVRGINSSVRVLSGALAGLGAGIGIAAVVELTSAWTDLNSRVTNAVGGVEQGAAVLDRLASVARRTYSPLEQTAESFLRNSTSLRELGYSTQAQLDLSETLNNSLLVSAINGDRARQVNEAYSKAIAQGTLRGEELNTIIQNGGRLAQTLADSLGVTTNELRALGAANKITTADLVGISSQLEKVRAEADAMPATIRDAFTNLSTSVFQFVGVVDTTTGSSAALAEQILNLASHVDTLAERFEQGELPIQRFLNAIRDVSREAGRAVGADQIGDGIREAFDGVVDSVEATEAALTDAEQALVNFGANTRGSFGALQPVVDDLIQQLLEGRGTAEDAAIAISAIGDSGDFGDLIGGLQGIVATLFSVRDAAIEARNITSDLGDLPSFRNFQKEFGVGPYDLSGDGAPGGPVRPPLSTTGRSGKSPTEQFAEALAQQERQNEILRQETALRATLNPLVNDYGYALERLKVQQELENEAKRAGLTLDAERQAAISVLADAYATASVEAAQLAEAQQRLRDTTEEWAGIAQDATRTFINDLIEGKTAAEALGNVLQNLGNQLINLGLNSLFGGQGGGLLGGLISGKRANGGPVNGGSTYLVGERGPELFTPSSAGRITSNADLQGGGVTVQMSNDFRGVDAASVARIEAGLDKLAANIVPTIRREIAVGPKKGRR